MASTSSSSCYCCSDLASTVSSSASSPSSGSSTPDKFYGHKDLAEFCEYVVADLFCLASPLSETPPRSPDLSKKNPPRLAEFIAYAIYRTRLAGPIIHQALFYLQRLKARYPAARGTESSPHRLFLSALMLSAKMSMDDCYSNKSWTIVGGNLFSLKEVNQMERELFGFLDYDLGCEHENLDGFVNDRILDWENQKQAASAQHKFQLCYPPELLAKERHHGRRHTADEYIQFEIPSVSSEQGASSSPQESKKRRVSDPTFASAREQAQRHKRASDAAIALLRPAYKASMSYSSLQNLTKVKPSRRSYSCHSTPPSLSSGSASLTESEASTPYSPLSLQQNTSPNMSEAYDECDKFSYPQQNQKSPITADC